MSSSTQAPADHLAANIDALTAMPGTVVPSMDDGGRVRLIDGAWRLLDADGRTLAIHSRHPDAEADRLVAEMLDRRAGDAPRSDDEPHLDDTPRPDDRSHSDDVSRRQGASRPDDASSPPSLIVAIGLGLGFLLDALERRPWHGTVLALEPEPDSLVPLLSRREWQSWITTGRLRLLVAPDYRGASTCWSLFGDGAWTPPIVVNPVFARTRPAEVERAHALVERLRFDAKANTDARRRFGGRYLLNTLSNLPVLASESDVVHLTDVARGLPAVVVGAGPSLDAALPALRLAQDAALIIAVDTALRPLLAAGIHPHLVVAVDPGEANAQHLWDLPACPDTHLVAEASVDPLAFVPFRGRTFLFSVADHQPWPWLTAHGQARGRLRAWGSVLTVAFDLALRVGSDPIVFVGADLAFSGGRPYCRGVTYDEHFRRQAEWGVPYEAQWDELIDAWPRTEETDTTGAPVRTAPHLVAVRDWLVEQMTHERTRPPHRRFINACGAGILRGPAIELLAPDDLIAFVSSSSPARGPDTPARLIRARYRAANGTALHHAAQDLLRRVGTGDRHHVDNETATLLSTWEQFGDGVTRARILDALSRASHALPRPGEAFAPEASEPETPPPDATPDASSFRAAVVTPEWREALAAHVPLVWMPIAPARMAPARSDVRLFRFRTTAARLILCVLSMPEGAVTEDGRPLKRGTWCDTLLSGEYYIHRDEVYFSSTDGSDPRYNRRDYRLLVPTSIEFVERVPLAEVLRRHL